MSTLILTNGDSAGDHLKVLFPDARVEPWHDVLHEGPVPLTATYEELSGIRADYLMKTFPQAQGDDTAKHQNREIAIRNHAAYERIELWFEHDLYDQLQLLQIVDYMSELGRRENVVLCQSDHFLGLMDDQQFTTLGGAGKPLPPEAFLFAQKAWTAFRQPTPESWAAFLPENPPAFPHMQSSVHRMLEELPDVKSGLARSERHALEHLNAGPLKIGALFGRCLESEEAMFMGDWSYFRMLESLAYCDAPLIAGLSDKPFQLTRSEAEIKDYRSRDLTLTDTGRAALAGDFAALAGDFDHASQNKTDRWWGGTHLTPSSLWRWNTATQTLTASAAD